MNSGNRIHRWRPMLAGVILSLCFFSGCTPLEPMAEPEIDDLQVTIDGLKTAVRDAQRTVTDLRTELESRRKELGESQIARAQLEGKLREAERRLGEARQVIELQREELATARTDRERLGHASRHLQGQLKQLQKQLAQHSRLLQNRGDVAPAVLPPRAGVKEGAPQVRVEKASLPPPPKRSGSTTEQTGPPTASHETSSNDATSPPPSHTVVVKGGDTLWSLSQKHRVDLAELRALNNVMGNHILPGQALWLPEPHLESSSDAGPGGDHR